MTTKIIIEVDDEINNEIEKLQVALNLQYKNEAVTKALEEWMRNRVKV